MSESTNRANSGQSIAGIETSSGAQPSQSSARDGAGAREADATGPQRGPWDWRPAESREQTLARILAAPNPLLEAAQPLLRALAEMPDHLPGAQRMMSETGSAAGASQFSGMAMELRHLLILELEQFQQLCERAAIRRQHIIATSYLLCTALDEAAHTRAWGLSGWPQHGLLVSIHQDTAGGTRCFQLLAKLLSESDEHLDLIEVFYQVLSLGFVGRYAGVPDGHRQIDAIRQRLLGLVSAKRGELPRELSPHWRGVPAKPLGVFRTVPIWLTASLLGIVVLGMLSWYKYHLLLQTEAAEQQILAIGKLRPPEPSKVFGLKERLKGDIERGAVSVQEDATRSVVTFRGDDMFGGGRSDVQASILPLLDKVSAELAQIPGNVTVVGHSDNLPIRTARFPSNQALSEARALTVSEYLVSKGVATGRIKSVGKGDTEPVADNKTATGRAKNRRVEIIVTQP
ncbi:type VI secretion system protein TssL, long form [Cupriavidus pauculus]|uniref:type VI secretion system protein TssL, long form n=1 Tax=Cupriavidus pauculus TaxID=82633 RepID=UPI000781BECC|nr:type VI secretion system protein TssL, long form [Cupriavidus pauculus]MBY4731108.1 type VI secretion system protein TssL, long form [Cupriavidus pauculus]